MADRTALPLVVFDGDDTLWKTERLYDDARNAAGRLVEAAGLDPAAWDALERQIDVKNAEHYGLSKARFPLSCVQAFEETARRANLPVDAAVAERVRAAAAAVFTATAVVYPGVEDTLRTLRTTRRLALLTQGDTEVQWHRIDTSGLKPFFDKIVIVEKKNCEALASFLNESAADAGSSWFIGNSLASDIHPARHCGMNAIWIDAPVWAYERREAPRQEDGVWATEAVSNAPAIIAAAEDRDVNRGATMSEGHTVGVASTS